MSKKIFINDDWKFNPVFSMDTLSLDFDDSGFENVRLPHTVVETPFNYFDESIYQMNCCYRKVIVPLDEWKNKRIVMVIEAAAHKAIVYINGNKLIEHNNGYTAIKVDLSDYLVFGRENVIVINVDSNESLNQPPFGNVIDYMTYGGIYREIYLEIFNENYIEDVFPKVTVINENEVFLDCELKFSNELSFKQELYDINKNMIISFDEGISKHNIKGIKLWDIDNPCLYYLKTILFDNNNVYDERWDRIGFREIEFKADGFYLNHKKIKIRGLNRHQSYPYVGYAMPKSMQYNDAKILKNELGLNAVRTSHYPQSHHFIDACDELGLLVFTEIPGWQHIGNEKWKEEAINNTREMILEYRNHPSIFMWGVRINESLDDDILYKKTNDIAHELDSTRPTSGVRYLQKSSLLEDVYAYNDFSHDGTNLGVLKRNKVTPDKNKGYIISEYNGHMFPTKSFDSEDHRVEHMKRHARVLDGYYKEEDIAGGFGWCMADYNTHKDFGSGDRICYHGVLDMFRNPKLAAYLYSSVSNKNDVLEISSMMDIGEHPACLAKDIYAITNADSVKLYKNNVFIKEFKRENTPYKNVPNGPILIDDFIGESMEKAEGFSHKKAEDIKKILLAANKHGLSHLPFNILLLAAKFMIFRGMKMSDAVSLYNKYVGNWGGTYTTYRFDAIKDGKIVNSQIRKPVTKVNLYLTASHTDLVENTTYDVASIQIKAVDENNQVLPFYQEAVNVEVTGPAQIIGPKSITLRGGMAGTYIKTIGELGDVLVKISGNNIEEKIIKFKVNIK